MKIFDYSLAPGVICGQENNTDLFIRKVVFEKGYSEDDFHSHPNSFEFYLVLKGRLIFANENGQIKTARGSIVYFAEAESHKIVTVEEDTTMLLIKKVGSTKS